MPQISPLNWFLIFMFNIMIFYLMIIKMNYFMNFYYKNNNILKNKMKKMNWKF
uniref:ATPase 8 n=1 Tax=Polistes sp. MD1 TaxID=454158 RepID=B4XEN4_9HYME|nr:ATPase 8 [Polistes sp. MD1]